MTLSQVKAENKKAGMFFFDRKTMNFFKSRIESTLLKGKYFITSEQYGDNTRKYSIREVLEDYSIKTVGEFQKYNSKFAAKEAVKSLK